MWQFLLKRLLLLIVTLFGIALISFVIVTMAPGDPSSMKMGLKGGGRGQGGLDDNTIRKNRELYYLDRPRLLDLSPPTRRTRLEKALAELDAKSELERKDAKLLLESAIGTAGLDVLMEVLPGRTATGAAARAELEGRLDALARAATDAERAAALEALSRHHGAFAPPVRLVDGRLPTQEERVRAWERQRRALVAEAEAPARRVLSVLAAVVPPAAGGPEVAADAPVADAMTAWQAWWAERAEDFSRARAREAATAWLERGDVAAAGAEGKASPELEALRRVGQVAAPPLMDALRAARRGSPLEQRAAYGLAVVCKKPWDLTTTPEERQTYAARWKERQDAIEAQKGDMHPSAYAREVAALGDEAAFVAQEEAREFADHRARWADWWFRAEEYYVDFSAPRQVVRAFTQTQFGRWMSRFVRLDFGESYKAKRPVWDMLAERLPVTLTLNAISLSLIYLMAVPLGIYSAVNRGVALDRGSTLALFVLYSLPSFWVGSMLIAFFTGEQGLLHPLLDLPAHHFMSLDADKLSTWGKVKDVARHLVLPVICLTYAELAYVSRQMRTGLLDVIRQDYVRTAVAKGLPRSRVIYKHALRNGLIPLLTLMGALLPVMFGGSVIIESIFSIDGLGKMAFDAILDRDYPVIMANLVISGFLTLLGILIADIAYAVVDPRIEFR
ncbi:MAG: ABC transporter permease [Planctomycetes bacterium]|nr:ABC transporter permease [Planctomycetota bacterium]